MFLFVAGSVEQVDSLAEAIPGGAALGSEGVFVGEARGLFDERADAGQNSDTLGGETAGEQSTNHTLEGASASSFGGAAVGQGREDAEEIVLAGSARRKGAMGIAEAVEIGMSGQRAAAAVFEREAAEGSLRAIASTRRHGDSIS